MARHKGLTAALRRRSTEKSTQVGPKPTVNGWSQPKADLCLVTSLAGHHMQVGGTAAIRREQYQQPLWVIIHPRRTRTRLQSMIVAIG